MMSINQQINPNFRHGSYPPEQTSPASTIQQSRGTDNSTINPHASPVASTHPKNPEFSLPNVTGTNINTTNDTTAIPDTTSKATNVHASEPSTSTANFTQSSHPSISAQASPSNPPLTSTPRSNPQPAYSPNFQGYPQYPPYPSFTGVPHLPNYPFPNFPFAVPSTQPSEASAYQLFTHNVPAALNPYLPLPLFFVSSTAQFTSWILTFSHYLFSNGYQDLLPDEFGICTRLPTQPELEGINSIFYHFVPKTSYPKWVSTSISSNIDTFDILVEAIHRAQHESDPTVILDQLTHLSFNGSEPAYVFTSRVKHLLHPLTPEQLSVFDHFIKRQILESLKGQYYSITRKYSTQPSSRYSINDILGQITIEYDFNQRHTSHRSNNSSTTSSNTSSSSSSSTNKFSKNSHNQSSSTTNRTNSTNNSSNSSNRDFKFRNQSSPSKPTGNSSSSASTSTPKNVNNINATTITTQPSPDDQSTDACLRPLSTSMNKDQYLMLDSGAGITLVNHLEFLHDHFVPAIPTISISSCSHNPIHYQSEGTLLLKTYDMGVIPIHAYYVPYLDHSILSTSDLNNQGLYMNEGTKYLEDQHGNPEASFTHEQSFNWLPTRHVVFPSNIPTSVVNHLSTKLSLDLVHRLFGHVNVASLYQSLKNQTFRNIDVKDVDWSNLSTFQCVDCLQGKSRKHSHIVGSRLKYQASYKALEYFHSDLFGPVRTANTPQWFISFTDEKSKFKWVFLLKRKDEQTILHILKSFVATIERHFNTKILAFQFDRGTEYTNSSVRTFLQENGIKIVFTTTGDSQSHGVAERLNLTLLNDCRTLLKSTHLPLHLWFYAVQYATIIRNSVYNNQLNGSPRSKIGLLGLDVKTILPFGQPVIFHLTKTPSKLHYKGEQGYALVPSEESYGYYIYVSSTGRVVDSTNYAIIKKDTIIDPETEYDDSIFDPIYEQLFDPSNTYIVESEDTTTLNSSVTDTSPNTDPVFNASIDHARNATTDLLDTTDNIIIPPHSSAPPIHDLDETADEDSDSSLDIDDDTQLPSTLTESDDIPSFNSTDDTEPLPNLTQDTITTSSVDNTKNTSTSHASSDSPSTTISPTISLHSKSPRSPSHPLSTTSFYSNNSTLGGRNILSSLTKAPTKNKEQNKKGRISKKTNLTKDYKVNYVKATSINQVNHDHFTQSLNYSQAITNNNDTTDKELFIQAYHKEVDQLVKMETWDNNPIDINDIDKSQVINSMFIFTIKRDGKHKCRLVARGDLQKPHTYQKDLISNTVHHYALTTCLSKAFTENFDIIQLDISSAYLYALLEEDLYIRSPPHMGLKDKVFKLQKSLYGLKQAGANWYKKITNYLTTTCNMKGVPGWSCVYHINQNKSQMLLCLFVDDMVVMSNDRTLANSIIKKIANTFDTKVVNPGTETINQYDILGLEITYEKGKQLRFGMRSSLEEKLPKFDIDLSRLRRVPGQPGEIITKDENLKLSLQEYKNKVKSLQQIIGFISYVAHKYRYDLLYYVNTLARHTLYPSKQVFRLATQLLQYLWYSRNKELVWSINNDSNQSANYLTAISDAAFANQSDYKSQFGNIFCLNGNIIGARSSKSTIICTSSTESEIYALCECIPRLQNLELLLKSISNKPTKLLILTDSQTSLSQLKTKDVSKIKSKFYGTKVLRVAEEIEAGNIKVNYINTNDNIADILTKPLTISKFSQLTKSWIH